MTEAELQNGRLRYILKNAAFCVPFPEPALGRFDDGELLFNSMLYEELLRLV